jgi:hypothetical protein
MECFVMGQRYHRGLREYKNRFERRYHPYLPLRLLPNAAGRSFSLTSSFALFHSSALVKVASEPIDQPRNIFVGGLDRDNPNKRPY